jgi:hypothetical protein
MGMLKAARKACLQRWRGDREDWDWSCVGLASDRAATVQAYTVTSDARVASAHCATDTEGGAPAIHCFPGVDPMGLSLLPWCTHTRTGKNKTMQARPHTTDYLLILILILLTAITVLSNPQGIVFPPAKLPSSNCMCCTQPRSALILVHLDFYCAVLQSPLMPYGSLFLQI